MSIRFRDRNDNITVFKRETKTLLFTFITVTINYKGKNIYSLKFKDGSDTYEYEVVVSMSKYDSNFCKTLESAIGKCVRMTAYFIQYEEGKYYIKDPELLA